MADSEENLALQQRLKAAVFFTVGQICEDLAADGKNTYTKTFIATLAEATYKQLQSTSLDLEAFAKHAKRSTIQPDDVLLSTRKSSQLYDYIHQYGHHQAEEKKGKKKGGGKKPGKKASKVTTQEDDD